MNLITSPSPLNLERKKLSLLEGNVKTLVGTKQCYTSMHEFGVDIKLLVHTYKEQLHMGQLVIHLLTPKC
jgi:hypothetical protein